VGKESSGEVRLIASPKNWIEGSAVEQLKKTAQLSGMRLAVGLPDLHPGKGSPIGAAFLTDASIYPALVGSDIGCGIGLWQTDLNGRKIRRETWAERLRNLDDEWEGDAGSFLASRGIRPSGFEKSLGTIGSGNHFAELQAVETVENPDACQALGLTSDSVYLCVHSGSRGFGEAILREHLERFAGKGFASDSSEAQHYLSQHEHAKSWARANRELIASRVLDRLAAKGSRLIDICHNSVEHEGEGWLHRKGAAPSTHGPVLIPGSRGAFSYVVLPKEPTLASGLSLAHGAGRKWSRSDSRGRLDKRFSAKDLVRTELGSYVICEDKDLLYEEAPQAYKNITVVIDDLVTAGLAEVVAILKPLVTYKVRR
jgi:release factor H-coupled RctB family protein